MRAAVLRLLLLLLLQNSGVVQFGAASAEAGYGVPRQFFDDFAFSEVLHFSITTVRSDRSFAWFASGVVETGVDPIVRGAFQPGVPLVGRSWVDSGDWDVDFGIYNHHTPTRTFHRGLSFEHLISE